ncbi:MAG TPA: hypothetical protein VEU29_06005, partial [Actinomycetota bacterium]|nr:hypothetical protein [Actinomycetota bacterium]
MAVDTRSAASTQTGTAPNQSSSAAAPDALPAPVAISAHNCIPRAQPVGVSLSLEIFESSVGDCISFVSPDPGPRVPDDRRRRARPSPAALAQRAFDRVISLAPSPELDVAPARLGLTGLRSYFWVGDDLEPVTATAGVPGLTVTAEARPVRYRWE